MGKFLKKLIEEQEPCLRERVLKELAVGLEKAGVPLPIELEKYSTRSPGASKAKVEEQ